MFNIDADDALIGRQVMKLMNALYQSSDDWLIYSNFASDTTENVQFGFSGPIAQQILESNSYRTYLAWLTSHMRTYLRELYMKIPKEYLLESETKFYWESYDRFEAYALVELAGPKHIKSIPNLVYYYTTSPLSQCTFK